MGRLDMLFSLGAFALASIASPSTSWAQFVKAPISLENVVLQQQGLPDQTLSLPYAGAAYLRPPCGVLPFGQLQFAVVNNGIDVSVQGQAFNCSLGATLRFDVVMEVPIVSTNAEAFIYFIPEPGNATLVNSPTLPNSKSGASVVYTFSPTATSSEIDLPVAIPLLSGNFRWESDPTTRMDGLVPLQPLPLIAGDLMRIPMVITILITGPSPGGGSVQGDVSARFEFRTRLPLPVSALPNSLSIPIGVMGLTGLALLRG